MLGQSWCGSPWTVSHVLWVWRRAQYLVNGVQLLKHLRAQEVQPSKEGVLPQKAAPEGCRAGNKELCGEWKNRVLPQGNDTTAPTTGERHHSKVAERMDWGAKKPCIVITLDVHSRHRIFQVSHYPLPLEQDFSPVPIHFGLDHAT